MKNQNTVKPTQEEKEQYFAQYWDLPVIILNGSIIPIRYIMDNISIYTITLRDKESLTDIELIKIAEIIGFSEEIDTADSDEVDYYNLCMSRTGRQFVDGELNSINDLHAYQYMTSIMIALPWMGYSIDQLQDFGWLKLKQKGGEGE